MSHDAPHDDDPRLHMGLPLPHGKLAMWLFLVTEIMFFTALIGTYVLIRNGSPPILRTEMQMESELSPAVVNTAKLAIGGADLDERPSVTTIIKDGWPSPDKVHLVEWMGAFNTFVLICSSLTVVLAHHALHKKDTKRAVQYIGVTLGLGMVFLFIKAIEYNAKFTHDILPSHIGEALPGLDPVQEKQFHAASRKYVYRVKEQLLHVVEHPGDYSSAAVSDCEALLDRLKDREKEVELKDDKGNAILDEQGKPKRVKEFDDRPITRANSEQK